jgi:hypothetical protein
LLQIARIKASGQHSIEAALPTAAIVLNKALHQQALLTAHEEDIAAAIAERSHSTR